MINVCLFVVLSLFVWAQQSLPDSVKYRFERGSNDSIVFRGYSGAALFFSTKNNDSALHYVNKALSLSARNKKWLQHSTHLCYKAGFLMDAGRFAESFDCLMESFRISENTANENMDWMNDQTTFRGARLLRLAETHFRYALLMNYTQNFDQSVFHNKEAIRIGLITGGVWGPQRAAYGYMNLGITYLDLKKQDSALLFFIEAENVGKKIIKRNNNYGKIIAYKGQCEVLRGNKSKALLYFHTALQIAKNSNWTSVVFRVYNELSRLYLLENNKDSSLYYALKMHELAGEIRTFNTDELNISHAYENLFNSYKLQNQNDSAVKYSTLAISVKDVLNKGRIQNLAAFQKTLLAEQLRLQNIEKEKIAYQNKIRTFFLLAGTGVLLLLAIIFYRNNRQKHMAKIKIEKAYGELKSTQAQLIQSEKMASLGELTAGIAHEIQNPLNFVNNFSEVNKELLLELQDELGRGNVKDVKALVTDIMENEQKINHHGKRADAIVKNMLQHSRTTRGHKEPTDINALTDEYLKLAYHGLRAKDNSFGVTMRTEFDKSIGNINIVSQDIGRVILNLITNAFYAVNEKKKQVRNGYDPTVTVSTKKRQAKFEIKISDNGNGIPEKILDKIFQPFFTTKPTAQGTGLGLSLSYDIVKAHGGEIKVETKEGLGSEFVIELPLN
jgi:signal transduction histidine kinase